ncbi:hypothetical protein ACFO3J_07995 [Streptomyces polygonati]|uniref:Integral membrane protein n=1 Tax=Streptomyces polygonati TaxID=1617087 RepID=A0ABV8HH65_9ACTN
MAADGLAEHEDALFVLTAAMLTPGRFPGVLGDDYPAACAQLGLASPDTGYGLVFGQDGTGARWTVATADTAMVACALAAWDCGLPYDLSPDQDSVVASLPGWPLAVAVSVPGLPEPYDPDEATGGRPPLAPPDISVWGPAQRRLGADGIAVRWREWRDRFDGAQDASGDGSDREAPAVPGPAGDRAAPAARTADAHGAAPTGPTAATGQADGSARPGLSHSGVRRALAAAEDYLRRTPPPGRVRSAYGALRADGPGWSLVARTDDMAFVLLDEAPGEVLPVGRGPSLPPLLEALGELAASLSPAAAVTPS